MMNPLQSCYIGSIKASASFSDIRVLTPPALQSDYAIIVIVTFPPLTISYFQLRLVITTIQIPGGPMQLGACSPVSYGGSYHLLFAGLQRLS